MRSFWAINQSRPERGFNLAKYLGNLSNDPVEVIEFLRTVSAEDIARAQTALLSKEANIFFLSYLPCASNQTFFSIIITNNHKVS